MPGPGRRERRGGGAGAGGRSRSRPSRGRRLPCRRVRRRPSAGVDAAASVRSGPPCHRRRDRGPAAAVLAASFSGAAGLPPGGVALALLDKLPFVRVHTGLSPLQQGVLDQIRLPRVALAAVVGGLLAQAGAAYQGVFRNPLTDSGTIGASAGAGDGRARSSSSTAAAARPSWASAPSRSPRSSARSAASWPATSSVPPPDAAAAAPTTLILAGVAVSSFLTAIQSLRACSGLRRHQARVLLAVRRLLRSRLEHGAARAPLRAGQRRRDAAARAAPRRARARRRRGRDAGARPGPRPAGRPAAPPAWPRLRRSRCPGIIGFVGPGRAAHDPPDRRAPATGC